MAAPDAGDLLIVHQVADGFVVLDAVSRQHVSTHPTFPDALNYASLHTKGKVWHQSTDNRGRPMGEPVPIQPNIRK